MSQLSTEIIHKELDLIQGCIERMAHNAFIVKGWTVLLLSGAFVFWENHQHTLELFFVIAISIVILWFLDAYFLQKERNFRELYKKVIEERSKGNTENLYNLDCKIVSHCSSFIKAFFSPMMLLFYLTPLLVCVILFVFFISNYEIKIIPKHIKTKTGSKVELHVEKHHPSKENEKIAVIPLNSGNEK